MTIVVGILGGIGSGKSTVAAMFEKLGALRVDADAIAREELCRSGIISEIRNVWGEEVLSDGSIDRRKLAERAFSSQEDLDRLNGIVHPGVISRIRELVDAARAAGSPAVVLDAPLLAETGLESLCDTLVYVDTAPETRKQRCKAANGLSNPDLKKREKFQISLDMKQKMSHHTVDNSSSEDLTFQQVSSIWGVVYNPSTVGG